MRQASCVVVVALLAGLARADVFVPVDFSSQFNMARDAAFLLNGATFPTGSQTFGGLPFTMGGDADPATLWAWNAHFAPDLPNAPGARALIIPVNQFGVTDAYSLINTYWGQPGPVSFASVTFIGASNVIAFNLIGNEDIRDYNQFVWTNAINGTSTVNIFDNGAGQRLDMQHFALPAAFATDTLLSVLLVDTGDFDFQRSFISGLTVVVPTPGLSVALAPAGVWALRRRRR